MNLRMLVIVGLVSLSAFADVIKYPPVTAIPPIVVTDKLDQAELREWLSILGCNLDYYNADPKSCFDPDSASFQQFYYDIQSSGIDFPVNDPTINCMALQSLLTRRQDMARRINQLQTHLALTGDMGQLHWWLTNLANVQFGSLYDSELNDITTSYCVPGETQRFDMAYLGTAYVKMMHSSLVKMQNITALINTHFNINLPFDKSSKGDPILNPDVIEAGFKGH